MREFFIPHTNVKEQSYPMKEIPENKARQGRSGTRVFIILIAALVLLAIGWAAVEFYGEAIDENTPRSDQSQTNTG